MPPRDVGVVRLLMGALCLHAVGPCRGAPLGARRWVVQTGLVNFLARAILEASQKIEKHLCGAATAGSATAGTTAPPAAAAGSGDGDACHDDDDGSSRYNLQTLFDLLGECCKYNPEGLFILTSALTPEEQLRLMRVACGRIVDSNVFLRSFMLTLALCTWPHGASAVTGFVPVPAHVREALTSSPVRARAVSRSRSPLACCTFSYLSKLSGVCVRRCRQPSSCTSTACRSCTA